ncbi:hypothetical protein QAD02_007437 [Eretmocerus hayati]|uniref:Uncharacterized protein n=1 Tax=Eretmocerus hayati TaxID=131215 RepID=A0ACC2N7Z0_9HYME|nr:hypothetical protein QAD02_007437 [Eretmocerus hayati]
MGHITCSSHSGNLLMKSMVSADDLVPLKMVLNLFKEPRNEQLLIPDGGTRLKNPTDVRFNSSRDAILSLVENLPRLRRISPRDEDEIPDYIVDLLLDPEFEVSLQPMLATLTPICIFVNMCQGLDRNVADAVDGWLSLRIPANSPGAYDNLLRLRIERAIQPLGYLAYFLHPFYQGIGLDGYQIQMADDYVRATFDADVINEYDDYMDHMNGFEDYVNRTNSPQAYWILLAQHFPHLSRIATTLIVTPALTTIVEGLFSAWKYVQSYIRNRPSTRTSRNFMNIYYLRRHVVMRYPNARYDQG